MTAVVSRSGVDSPYAWRLAVVSMLCVALGGGGIYLPMVGLKEIAAEFGDQRAVPSFAYMVGFFGMGVGGVFMGWLADRTSPRVPLLIAGISIGIGGWLTASGGEIVLYVGYALLLGFFGNAGTFTPAMNNVQGWFERRRNTAVAIISVGPAISGSVWPQVYRVLLPEIGWRQTLTVYGLVAGILLLLGALYVRPAPVLRGAGGRRRREEKVDLPLPSSVIMVLLSAASFCCCAAMALPFVHMVAFCGDLGYPAARGSEAVSLVLISAIVATFVMARLATAIGPLPVSLLCSVIQIGSLVGFMIARDITSIYALSLLHGIPFIAIVQGYALNLRFLYGPTIAGWRLGVVMLFAMVGMAVGGWLGGFIFDATLSYRLAFQAALAFNLLNLMLLGALYIAQRRRLVGLPS
jgi:MFS family permease